MLPMDRDEFVHPLCSLGSFSHSSQVVLAPNFSRLFRYFKRQCISVFLAPTFPNARHPPHTTHSTIRLRFIDENKHGRRSNLQSMSIMGSQRGVFGCHLRGDPIKLGQCGEFRSQLFLGFDFCDLGWYLFRYSCSCWCP